MDFWLLIFDFWIIIWSLWFEIWCLIFMLNIFQKFSTHSRNVIKKAFDFALALGERQVTPKHLLLALSQQTGSIAAQILAKAKVQPHELKTELSQVSANQSAVTQVGLAPETKKLLEKAVLIASLNRHKYIGTEHLLASILSQKDSGVMEFFKQKNVDFIDLQRQVETILNSTSKFPDLGNAVNYPSDAEREADFFKPSAGLNVNQSSALEIFAVNLTDPLTQKKIDPVIGREEEINRLIQILCRRNKNNPLLLGDPGVGKTAIVEGLAKKISQRQIPPILAEKIIYQLDLSLVVAGTSFRGEFENRLKQIILEVKKNPNIILFIDEIHNIIGAGSATGSMDAANILKPALARGEIRCLGATTLEDYKKYIESDPALERRFQPILINQPSIQKTIEILRGIKNNYEFYHQVKISDEAIINAAKLADRYLVDRFLPDKAIDLIDEAAAAVKIKESVNFNNQEISLWENQLKEIEAKKREAVTNEKFNFALKIQKQEKEILDQLKAARQKLTAEKKISQEITKKDIIQIISRITGIPLDDLLLEEKKRLINLEKLLAKKIIDQDDALKSVAEFIRRARTGITDARRPIGSFIFLGPSGVGKTELAKILAEVVFGSPQALVKIDMSEFAESFNISKLIGAPAGYVGYKEGAKLTDAVKRRPYIVVLFDEIEKAHHQVYNLLLQILEDGFLTDATGKIINFKNTIIIMTSNLGSDKFVKQQILGFEEKNQNSSQSNQGWQEIQDDVLKKLEEKFPPEFLSRVDKTIVFRPLNQNAIGQIAQLQLQQLTTRLNQQNLSLEIAPEVAKIIGRLSFNPKIGARAVRKNIIELIESQIAQKLLSHNRGRNKKIKVKIINDQISVES